MKIGAKLRAVRDQLRYSTRTLSRKVGVSQSTYVGWEHDKYLPSLYLFCSLAAALELSPVTLLSYLLGNESVNNVLEKRRDGSRQNTNSMKAAANQPKHGM